MTLPPRPGCHSGCLSGWLCLFFCLSVSLSVCLSVFLSVLSVCLSVCLSACLPVYLPACLSVCFSVVVYLSVSLCCLSVQVSLSICLFVSGCVRGCGFDFLAVTVCLHPHDGHVVGVLSVRFAFCAFSCASFDWDDTLCEAARRTKMPTPATACEDSSLCFVAPTLSSCVYT